MFPNWHLFIFILWPTFPISPLLCYHFKLLLRSCWHTFGLPLKKEQNKKWFSIVKARLEHVLHICTISCAPEEDIFLFSLTRCTFSIFLVTKTSEDRIRKQLQVNVSQAFFTSINYMLSTKRITTMHNKSLLLV